jgi:WD40 repeat protein
MLEESASGYVRLYKYNGTQFVAQQLISYTKVSNYAKLSNDASLLITGSLIDGSGNSQVYIYSQSYNVFTLIQTISLTSATLPNYVRKIWITKDNNIIVFVAQGTRSAYVYKKSGSTYSQSQVIVAISTGYYYTVFITDDYQYLVLGDSKGFVDIYQLNGASYTFLQTLSDATLYI